METIHFITPEERDERLDEDELQTLKILQQGSRDRMRKHILFAGSTHEGKLPCQISHCLY